jgi:Cu/Ag efflux protein CusF
MNGILRARVAAGLVAGALMAATMAVQAAQNVPAMLIADGFFIETEVLEVDLAARKVTVRRPDGGTVTKTVGPEVQNLGQLKAGDRVEVRYSEALAVSLRKGDGIRVTEESAAGGRGGAGSKPGAAGMREVHFVADIIAMDASAGVINVRGAQGRLFQLRLENPSVLQGFKVGDQIEGVFRQVISISARASK